MAKFVVGPVDSLPPGSKTRGDGDRRAIAVFNVEGRFFALRDVCPHQGAQLSSGTVVGCVTAVKPGGYEYAPERKLIRWPWHGWEDELANGQSWFDPAHNRVRPYPVSIEPGDAL